MRCCCCGSGGGYYTHTHTYSVCEHVCTRNFPFVNFSLSFGCRFSRFRHWWSCRRSSRQRKMLKKNQQQPQLDSQIDIKTTKANMQRKNYNNHSNKLSHCVCVCVRAWEGVNLQKESKRNGSTQSATGKNRSWKINGRQFRQDQKRKSVGTTLRVKI